MVLNEYGNIVKNTWEDLPNHIAGIELDEFVVMPNHFHCILVITGAGLEPAPTGGAHVVGNRAANENVFGRRINNKRCTPGVSVWQRNYREHIVRNETELNHIRQYIRDNPARWESDKLYTPTAARPTNS